MINQIPQIPIKAMNRNLKFGKVKILKKEKPFVMKPQVPYALRKKQSINSRMISLNEYRPKRYYFIHK